MKSDYFYFTLKPWMLSAMASTLAHAPPAPVPGQCVPRIMGNSRCSWFVMVQAEGGALPNFYLGNFKGFSPPHHGRPPWLLPSPVALRRPFQGKALVSHIMGDSGCAWLVIIQAGGASCTQLLLGNFIGCCHIMGDRRGLYRCWWPSGAHSREKRLIPTSWGTSGVLGLL